mmetsp:Transcript_50496/g.141348  ORF Transcript_50496/g.141348 Transcript_50496/m.141348 type:complete len:212 (-) Transcript_50496:1685-2320(-)
MRPILWMWSTTFLAKSNCTTCSKSGMSMPRDKTSVVTKSMISPSRNFCSRSRRSSLPIFRTWRPILRKPCFVASASARSAAFWIVLQKTSVFSVTFTLWSHPLFDVGSCFFRCSANIAAFSSRSVGTCRHSWSTMGCCLCKSSGLGKARKAAGIQAPIFKRVDLVPWLGMVAATRTLCTRVPSVRWHRKNIVFTLFKNQRSGPATRRSTSS